MIVHVGVLQQKYWTRPPNVQFLFDHFSMSTWTITPGVVLVLSKVRNNAALFAMVYGCVVGALFLRRTSIVVLATPVVALFSGKSCSCCQYQSVITQSSCTGAALGIVLVEWLAYTPICKVLVQQKNRQYNLCMSSLPHFKQKEITLWNHLSLRTSRDWYCYKP